MRGPHSIQGVPEGGAGVWEEVPCVCSPQSDD